MRQYNLTDKFNAVDHIRNTTHNACMRYRRGHPYIVSWAIPTAYHVQDRNHCLVQDEGQRP
jgi:hypothetical protein